MRVTKESKNKLKKNNKKNIKLVPFTTYLSINLIIGGIYYIRVFVIISLYQKIISTFLYFTSIISYFIISYSYPGYAVKDENLIIDEKIIRSFEEKRSKMSDSVNIIEYKDHVDDLCGNFNSNYNPKTVINTDNNDFKSLKKIKSNKIIDINLADSNIIKAYSHTENTKNNNPINDNNSHLSSLRRIKESESMKDENIVIQLQETDKKSNKETTEYENNFCIECLIDTPLRAKHCKSCNKCIITFDHHCSWIGNCIGEDNKWLFIIFLLVHVIEIGYFIITSLFNYTNDKLFDNWIKNNYLTFLLTLFLALFFTFVLSLLVFVIQISLVNQTTWENYSWHKIPYMIKYSKSQKSPFNKNIFINMKYIFCYKKYKSKELTYIEWKNVLNTK